MPQSLANFLLYTVFSTKNRQPSFQDAALRNKLHRYLGGISNQMDCHTVIIGGTEDHVHLLTTLSRTTVPSELVKELKRVSSIGLKTKGPEFANFSWQSGYGMFSVSHSRAPEVENYIAKQEERHRTLTFQNEFRELLKRHAMPFDERYVWD